jgi:hypothetical protein
MSKEIQAEGKSSKLAKIGFMALGAFFGCLGTVGANYVTMKMDKSSEVLNSGITELSHINKELILEQKALTERIGLLAEKAANSPEIQVDIGDIINRVNNIVQSTTVFESNSRDLVGLARSVRATNNKALYNPSADTVLAYGQAVTVCGNENTLGVESEFGRAAVIYLNGRKYNASVGEEYKFLSPAGPSMVSYLGKNAELYEFRVVCGSELSAMAEQST